MNGRTLTDRIRPWPLLIAAALVAAGCGENGNQTSRRQPIGQPGGMQSGGQPRERDLPAEVTAPLDSGNVAYRRGDYEAAIDHFRTAANADPAGESAGWFGVYMAEKALGNDAAADSALSRAGELSGAMGMHPAPDSADPGSGWQHPDTTGSAGERWQHPDTTGNVWTHPDTTGTRGG